MSVHVKPDVRVNWRVNQYWRNTVRIVLVLAAVHALLGLAGANGWVNDVTWSLMFKSFMIITGCVVVFAAFMAPQYRARVVREENAANNAAALDADVQHAAQAVVDAEEVVTVEETNEVVEPETEPIAVQAEAEPVESTQ